MPSGTDLVRAIVRRSVRHARRVAAAHASANRTYTVRVSRPGAQPTFDRRTAAWSNPEDLVLYEGPARVYTVSGGGSLAVGDEPTYYAATRVSIDDYVGEQPRRDDLVHVLVDEESVTGGIAGRTFRVDDVDLGGLLGAGTILSVSGVAPSRQTGR